MEFFIQNGIQVLCEVTEIGVGVFSRRKRLLNHEIYNGHILTMICSKRLNKLSLSVSMIPSYG